MNIEQWTEEHLQGFRINHADEEIVMSLFRTNVEEPARLLANTLRYLDDSFGISRLYYVGCGWDIIPRETLGTRKVVHLSLEDRYFLFLGEGLKVQGDYKKSPFADNSFDATLISRLEPESALVALDEYIRVTKNGGLFIVYAPHFDIFKDLLNTMNQRLRKLQLPTTLDGVNVYQKQNNFYSPKPIN